MELEIFTRQELADFLHMPVRTIDFLVHTRQIPFSRLGKRAVRFDKARIMEWFAEREGVEYRMQMNKK